MIESAWLLPALILNTFAMALVFGLSALLQRRFPEPYFRWWVRSAGWRAVSSVAGTLYGHFAALPWLSLLSIAGMVAGSLCLLDAAFAYRGRPTGRPWRWWLAAAMLAASAALVAVYGHLPEVFYLPGFLLLAFGQAAFAWAFWPRAGDPPGIGAPIVAMASAVWAVDSLMFPAIIAWNDQLLAPMTSFASLLTVTLGMAMIVHLLEASLAREQALGREVQERSQELARSRTEAELYTSVALEQEALVRQIVHDLRNSTQALGLIAEAIEAEAEAAGNDDLKASVGALDRQLTFISTFLKQKLAWIVDRGRAEAVGTDVAAALEALEGTHRPIAATKAQALVIEPPDGAVAPLRMSPVELGQVLGNLVINALQHCPVGATVRVGCAFSDGWVVFRVADDGPGIPADRQAMLGRTPPRADGTGVGLRNAFELITRGGGSFTVVSAPGAGTTFHVTLPLLTWGGVARLPAPPAAQPSDSALR